jgi:protein Tob/BTG
MKPELKSAANFMVYLISLGRRDISKGTLKQMRNELVTVLRMRYRDHWFQEIPVKGSGYRSIRINGKMDPIISQAGETVGISQQLLLDVFPSEMTIWIDPFEVTYRLGENGSILVLYDRRTNTWKPPTQKFTSPIREYEWKVYPVALPSSRTIMESRLDPRNSVSIEQLAAYVGER